VLLIRASRIPKRCAQFTGFRTASHARIATRARRARVRTPIFCEKTERTAYPDTWSTWPLLLMLRSRMQSLARTYSSLVGTLEVNFDKPRAVVLAVQIPTDTVLDSEGALLVSKMPGVWLRTQKCEFDAEVLTAETFERAAGNIRRAAAACLPASEISAVGLSCTSMSFVLGPERIDEQLRGACPNAVSTDMARAQAAALHALDVTRIALVTPYIQDLAEKNAAMLESQGLSVVAHQTMGLTHDSQTDKVSKETIKAWAADTDCDDAQALVIGCSAMRACEPGFIDELEKAHGKPVVTSTQAFMWSLLRKAGVADQIDGYGTLFRSF
jgi:maleate isomerase